MGKQFNLDSCLEKASKGELLDEPDLRAVIKLARDVFLNEETVVKLKSPLTICGDIHGQYFDLEELFKLGGEVPRTRYVFLGDYVDRGRHSVQTITRLLTLKVRYPEQIFLLRGNHECRKISSSYGFYDECLLKFGNPLLWESFCQLFQYMPIAAVVDGSYFCVHGGISPNVRTISAMNSLDRFCEIPQTGAFADLLWSDPDEVEDFEESPRGSGWLFGRGAAERFLQDNGISMICRAHQLVMEGYQFLWDNKLVTVWSAPNYCYRCGNLACIFEVTSPAIYEAKTFGPANRSSDATSAA
ncbi:Serine [Trichuris trichiura]|uniref:Serine/threonine-protein phosphatase n=1 Tax=Trichuris trichiura TaxID=36087 RepID=A0A077Z4J5_TRITR|nr:Serine [Trichuris trichiura]